MDSYGSEPPFPCRVEGWLNVWESESEEAPVAVEGETGRPRFDPYFCVLLQNTGRLTFHRKEEDAAGLESCEGLTVVRLDGGRSEFYKRWGYDTLESIRENAIQHGCPNSCDEHSLPETSAESFFRKRTMQIRNESLPDLSRSLDFDPGQLQGRTFFRRIFNTSVDKAGGERRGSLPVVSHRLDPDVMDATASPPSRLASFFSKRGFKTNLKRTKSVTKLDRKRGSSTNLSNDGGEASSLVGSLKRTMSLGRLTRKRNRSKSTAEVAPTGHGDLSLISSRMRTSRSHESLLAGGGGGGLGTVELGGGQGGEIAVKPLHASVLGQDHCFQVSTHTGSKFFSCRTADERDKWLDSLRRTMKPNREECRRTENSLKLWVVEAKNVPVKKRYFCEVCLDKTLYARTSTKMKADMLFWGEHFEFNDLHPVDLITINLYREADRKKKKDKNTLVGYINIASSDISTRQFTEKWYTCSSGLVGKGKEPKSELPLIRVKARFQTISILPLQLYSKLTEYVKSHYCKLCDALEPLLSVKDKEDFATALVHIMQKLGHARDCLVDIVMTEISRLDNEQLTFRGNSIATKAMEAYMKLVGEKYLHDTLGDFVKTLIESSDDCEVDPTKVASPAQLQCHQKNLDMYCNMAWVKVINSYCYFPVELRDVFAGFREQCRQRGREEVSNHVISASIFLRFLCPAILSPSLFNLTQEFPHERASRNLTLIAKTIQTLANFRTFGGKEEFMTFMNAFVEREEANMTSFLKKISSTEPGNHFLEFDGFVDLGKELSLLHQLLQENLGRAPQATQEQLEDLTAILEDIASKLEDPEVGTSPPDNRRSQAYDNLVTTPLHTPSHAPLPEEVSGSLHSTSPTQAVRDLLKQCGENADDLALFFQQAPPPGPRSRTPSAHSLASAFPSKTSKTSQNGMESHTHSLTYHRSHTQSSRHQHHLHHHQHHHHHTAPRPSAKAPGPEVSDVSCVSSARLTERSVEQSWSRMVSEAEELAGEGDYMDLIPFMDEEAGNSSLEMEPSAHGSQMSISQVSTIASSGYQSFGYSQSNSPVEVGGQGRGGGGEDGREGTKSPIIHYPLTPLSFSNPLYRHQMKISPRNQPRQVRPDLAQSSSSSLSGSEDSSTVRQSSPSQTDSRPTPHSSAPDPLRSLSQLSSSSSESLTEEPEDQDCRRLLSGNSLTGSLVLGGYRNGLMDEEAATVAAADSVRRGGQGHGDLAEDRDPDAPLMTSTLNSHSQSSLARSLHSHRDCFSPAQCSPRQERSCSFYDTLPGERPRPYQASHSMDFGSLQHRHSVDQLRRVATDTGIAQQAALHHPQASASSSSLGHPGREDGLSLSARRLSPQSSVHMGISSVQRKLMEQERTKQEYENEVVLLRLQLQEAQSHLNQAEARLAEHEVDTHSVINEWQDRLVRSEERMRKEQAAKNDQMKAIISRLADVEDNLRQGRPPDCARLVSIEEELKADQAEMQRVVKEKETIIEAQERRIRSLDMANARLLQALNELKGHCHSPAPSSTPTPAPRNGIRNPTVRPRLTAAELSGFKSSSC